MKIRPDIEYNLRNFILKDNQYTIPVFIPHKGCPNDCVFCNQKRISGELKDIKPEDVKKEIDKYLSYYSRDKKIEIAFFGGSFTGIDMSLQEEYLKVANEYILDGRIDSIRLSTRPDYINDEILTLLKKYNVKTIELGVQSLDNNVLEASRRGHSAKDVENASKKILEYGFTLGHQIMIGLPKSSEEAELETIRNSLKMNISQLRIYPVYVVEDSELYNMYNRGEYSPLSVSEAVKRCIKMVKECRDYNVAIIRIGLQSTDEITTHNSKLYGPVSDNFAEYVMAGIIREDIEDKISNNIEDKEIDVIVPKKYVSVTIGPKKINKIYFENKYNMIYKVKGEC